MSMKSRRARQFKIVLIGDGAVGKTSIRRSYMGEGFVTSHLATLGVDFARKDIEFEGVPTRLVIWDLAGQPSFETVRRHYYMGCMGIILVFSVVDQTTYDNATRWLIEVLKYMDALQPVLILGNKIDLRQTNQSNEIVSKEDGNNLTKRVNEQLDALTAFFETSALTGENINRAFQVLVRMMVENTPL